MQGETPIHRQTTYATNHRHPKLWYILDALWLVAWAVYGLIGVSSAPLHGDEVTQLYMARDYFYQFVENDWDKVFYHPDADAIMEGGATQQQLRLLNGTLPKYAFGWAIHQVGYDINALTDQWDWGLNWEQNEVRGVIPQPDVLTVARLTAWGAWCLSFIALFYLARTLSNHRTAYIATLIFILNPAVLLHGRRLMMDSFMLAGIIATVWASIVALRGGRLWQYGLLGFVAGLALASKHTALFALVGIFGAMGLLALLQLLKTRRPNNLFKLVGAGILTLVVFYSVNPAWWGAPLARAQDVLTMRQSLLEGQTATFGGYEDFNQQLDGWFRQTFGAVPMYHEVNSWLDAPQAQAQLIAYDGEWYAGLAPDTLGGLVLTMLTVSGIVALWRSQTPPYPEKTIIFAWALLMLVLTLLITPIEWQRYYLPIYPALALLAGFGANWLIEKVANRTTL